MLFLQSIFITLLVLKSIFAIDEVKADSEPAKNEERNDCQKYCDSAYGSSDLPNQNSCEHGCTMKAKWNCPILCSIDFMNIHACKKGCYFNNRLPELVYSIDLVESMDNDNVLKEFDRPPMKRPSVCSFMRHRIPRFVFIIVDALSTLFILCIIFVILRAIYRMRNKNRTIVYREDELPLYEDITFDKKMPIIQAYEEAGPLPEKQKLDI